MKKNAASAVAVGVILVASLLFPQGASAAGWTTFGPFSSKAACEAQRNIINHKGAYKDLTICGAPNGVWVFYGG